MWELEVCMAEILWPGYIWQKYIRRDRGMYGRGNETAEVMWPRYVFTPFCPLWVSLHSPRITWTSPNTNVVTRQPFSPQWAHKWWLTLFSSIETRKNKPCEFYKLNNVLAQSLRVNNHSSWLMLAPIQFVIWSNGVTGSKEWRKQNYHEILRIT